MDIKSFEELTAADPAILAFGSMAVVDRDSQARWVQEMVADADLAAEIPRTLRESFDRLRRLFAYGLFYYETFTLVGEVARLVREQALGERIISFYDGAIPMVAPDTGAEQALRATTLEELRKQLRKLNRKEKGRWRLKLTSTGRPCEIAGFNATFPQLLAWARLEQLVDGQMNRATERLHVVFRNSAAHPQRRIDLPHNAARELRDLAEYINRLWGHPTPGGRVYPAPVTRRPVVVGWRTDQGESPDLLAMAATAAAQPEAPEGVWRYIAVLAAVDENGQPTDDIFEFDARHETTRYPCELLYGPCHREEIEVWLAGNTDRCDVVRYLDRVFAVQHTNGRTYLARRPEVALGIDAGRRGGTWHLVRADHPVAAFNHVRYRHKKGCGCPAHTLASASWESLATKLGDAGTAAAEEPPPVAVPRRQPYPPDVGWDGDNGSPGLEAPWAGHATPPGLFAASQLDV